MEVRNSIKHNNDKNAANFEESKKLAEKLEWYIRNQHEALDYRHRFLIDFTLDDVFRWKLATKRAKLTLLDNAAKFYENLQEQHCAQQSTIDDWIGSYMKLRSGRLVPRRPKDKTKTTSTDEASIASDDTEEFEFDGEL